MCITLKYLNIREIHNNYSTAYKALHRSDIPITIDGINERNIEQFFTWNNILTEISMSKDTHLHILC